MGESITAGGEIVHGGDLTAARARFGDAGAPWIDLSTGINPLPWPVPPLAPESWGRLPDRAALAELEAAAGAAFGVRAGASVVAAPGTQALIQMLPRLLPARRVAILGFTYQEHAAAWAASGAGVQEVATPAAAAGADVAVVVNPNNPDGRRIAAAELADLAGTMAERGGRLVVDEAFMDLEDGSLVPHLPATAVVLRSFGKTYGLAGLRLGFAVAAPNLAAALRADLGPWAVSGPAIAIGTAAYRDAEWRATTRTRLAHDAARLDALLAEAGFEPIGGTTLFRLHAHDDAAGWYERFGRAGILVRPFAARPRWLRFGLPGDEAAWARLGAALTG